MCRARESGEEEWFSTRRQKVIDSNGNFIFSLSHGNLENLEFCHLCAIYVEQQTVCEEDGISGKMAVDWASFCGEAIFDAFILNRVPIKGQGTAVEVDESKFGHRKYCRGHQVEGQWSFGGLERESGQGFMLPVAKRDRDMLIETR